MSVVVAPPPVSGAVEEPRTRVVLRDATHDVWRITEGEDEKPRLAGDRPTVDVTRAVVAHRSAAVVVRVQVRDLRRVHTQGLAAFVTTPEGVWIGVAMSRPGNRAGRHELVDYVRGDVRCQGMTHHFGYAADRISMRIPRSCLSSPRWVRVGVLDVLYQKVDGDFVELTDNPHNGRHHPGESGRLYRTP